MTQPTQAQKDALVRERLNRETARIRWSELERQFAAGNVVFVAAGLDLIEVGVSFANDDKQAVAALLAQQRVGRVTDEQALAWTAGDAELWAMVVAPFVLVQESKSAH